MMMMMRKKKRRKRNKTENFMLAKLKISSCHNIIFNYTNKL